MSGAIDAAGSVRKGEELPIEQLDQYIAKLGIDFSKISQVQQFPGGFSNLTYLISDGQHELVLRMPPRGANIKSAHDMGREYNVLSLLAPIYSLIPKPIAYCEDAACIGAPFYLMERVSGIILRNKIPKGYKLNQDHFKTLSTQTVDNLVNLHSLELEESNLISLGKPKGYLERQVEGWIRRYFKAETDSISMMNAASEWLISNKPDLQRTAFIHNDYKYDNLVLDPKSLSIKAVLDWEMATVGDPLMDLGTSLAYWVEASDHDALKAYNLTWIEGNLTRNEVVEYYENATGIQPEQVVFYYVFGCFKLGVIAQQIYARYKQGHTTDPRFAMLIHLVKACGANAMNAIKFNRINNFN